MISLTCTTSLFTYESESRTPSRGHTALPRSSSSFVGLTSLRRSRDAPRIGNGPLGRGAPGRWRPGYLLRSDARCRACRPRRPRGGRATRRHTARAQRRARGHGSPLPRLPRRALGLTRRQCEYQRGRDAGRSSRRDATPRARSRVGVDEQHDPANGRTGRQVVVGL